MDEGATADVFLFEAFRLDRRAGALFRRDDKGAAVPVAIGSRGLAVLSILIARHGDLVSKDEIMQAVWPETVVEDNNLTVQISALRRVLDQGRAGGSCIQTIPGRGYRFAGAVTRIDADARSATQTISHDGGRSRPRLSIVVLPFANLSNDREQQYFADGITEDLTTDLSRIEGSFVISRNTAFTYRNKSIDTKLIGCELGVRYALEGSVRRSDRRVRNQRPTDRCRNRRTSVGGTVRWRHGGPVCLARRGYEPDRKHPQRRTDRQGGCPAER